METIEIELTRLFVKVIQHGGFTRAAKALLVPKSTVSKAVAKLEAITGTKLLVRTTRSQTLTAAGRIFYETCLGPLQVLEDAQKSLFGHDNIVTGKIKLTAPEDLGNYVITPAISRLCSRYPQLDFEMTYSNEIFDLVKDGFDMAVRIGQLKESRLVQRKVGDMEMIPVASPKYLKTIDRISVPKDLEKVDGITLRVQTVLSSWSLKNEKRTVDFKLKSRIQSNQMSAIITAALSSAGVAIVPSYIVRPHLKSGELVRLLPDWSGIKMPVYIVSPISMNSTSRLNILQSEIVSTCREAFKI